MDHLTWLKRESFASIAMEESGAWAGAPHRPTTAGDPFEMVITARVVSSTLAATARPRSGPAWSRRTDATDVEIEFRVPGVSTSAAPKLGAAYVALYTKLWDQAEAMMQPRARELARRGELLAALPAGTPPLDLGPVDALRTPFDVEFAGRPYRVGTVNGALRVHSTLCPHWLGPLEAAPEPDGSLRCPWHGYRFELASGRGCEQASRLRLPPAPRVVIDGGRARLEA